MQQHNEEIEELLVKNKEKCFRPPPQSVFQTERTALDYSKINAIWPKDEVHITELSLSSQKMCFAVLSNDPDGFGWADIRY